MKDSEFISAENFRRYCSTNEAYVTRPIRAIALEFPGLGGGSCLGGQMDAAEYATPYARQLGADGILLIYTCPGPWSWMNRGAVRICDLIEDAAISAFGLPADVPTVATGGSMGGLGALIFAIESRHNVTACAAACPCYDVLKDYASHEDFARTFLSAVAAYDMPLEDALKSISPIHQLDRLPRIPYYIVGDGQDDCFSIEGMDAFVAAMKQAGHDVDYRRLPGLGHGGFTPEARDGLTDFVRRLGRR